MANYTTTITNEGAALLASVIANQGTLTFNEFRFSENDYTGQESTLTEVTFLGVFITASAAASVIDSTTIKASAQFNNSAITGNHDLYSIGIIGTDGNTTALIAVCTTTDPDVIREPLTGTSTYAFNVSLTVSDTSQINVFGTTAAIIYDIDVVDNLTSTATNKPLSANQGRLVADNLAANENVYGAKNKLSYPWYETTKSANGLTFTDNGDGTLTLGTGTAGADTYFEFCRRFDYTVFLQNGTYLCTGCPQGVPVGVSISNLNADSVNIYSDTGNGVEMPINGTGLGNTGSYVGMGVEVKNGTVISTPITFKPMIRDARVLDPTFAPFAETNLQLTRKTSGLSNENLLDNPFFTVNQRGATTVTTDSQYGADRWYKDGGTSLTFSTGQVIITSAICRQIFENQLPNGAYTASALLSDGTIYSGTAIKSNDTNVIEFLANASIRLIYNASTKAFGIDTANVGGVTTTVKAVKLEVGSVSTLANDVEPNPTTELLKCQREFYRKISKDNYNAYFASGICTSTTGFVFVIKLPCEMKSAPSISFAGSFYITNGLINIAVTSFVVAGFSGDTIGIIAVTSGGLTAGDGALIYANSLGDYIDFTP